MSPLYDDSDDDDEEEDIAEWTATPDATQEALLQKAWQRLQNRRDRLKKHWTFQERQRGRFMEFFLENTGGDMELMRENQDRDLIRDSNGKYRTFLEMRELLEEEIDEAAEGLQQLSKAIETEGLRTEKGNQLIHQLAEAERMTTQALRDAYKKFDLELSRMQQMLLMALERAAAAHRRFDEGQALTKEAQKEVRELQSQWADVSEVLKALSRFSREEVQQAINQTKGKRPVERPVLENFYQAMDERTAMLTEEKARWKQESDQALVVKEKLVVDLQAELVTTRRLWQEAVDDAVSMRAGMQITKTKAAEYIARHMALLNGNGGLNSTATSARSIENLEATEDPDFKIQPWAPVQCATKSCQTDPPPPPPVRPVEKGSVPNSPKSNRQRLQSPTSATAALQGDGPSSPRAKNGSPTTGGRVTDILNQQFPTSPRSTALGLPGSSRSPPDSNGNPSTLPSGDVPQLSVPPKPRLKRGKAGKEASGAHPASPTPDVGKSTLQQSPPSKKLSKSGGSAAPPADNSGGAVPEVTVDAVLEGAAGAGAAVDHMDSPHSSERSLRDAGALSPGSLETPLVTPKALSRGRPPSLRGPSGEGEEDEDEEGLAGLQRQTSYASSMLEPASLKCWGAQSSEALGVLRFVIFKFDATVREGLRSGWQGVDPQVGFLREEELLRAAPLAKPVQQEIRVLNNVFKTLMSYLLETSQYVDQTRVRFDALKKELDEDPRFKQVEMVKQKVLELKAQQDANEQAARQRYSRLQAMFREQAVELAQLRAAASPALANAALGDSLGLEEAATALSQQAREAARASEEADRLEPWRSADGRALEGLQDPLRFAFGLRVARSSANAMARPPGLDPSRHPSMSASQPLPPFQTTDIPEGAAEGSTAGVHPVAAKAATYASGGNIPRRDARARDGGGWSGSLASLEVGWKPMQDRPSNALPSLAEPLDARQRSSSRQPGNFGKSSAVAGRLPSSAAAHPVSAALITGQAMVRPTTPIVPFLERLASPPAPPKSKHLSRCPSPEYYATAGFRLLAMPRPPKAGSSSSEALASSWPHATTS
eukprot:GGOE01001803.1.p1 GENE.GGOE01001803.1~~GGOE01001803.1.p1  ORF type:complete len:1057 (-),score=275.91 GGOE01001803.1:446-3616(-)